MVIHLDVEPLTRAHLIAVAREFELVEISDVVVARLERQRRAIDVLVESGTPVERRRRGWRLLGDLGAGEGGRVRAVYERDRSLLEYLDRVGLRPGVLVELASRNVDETLTLRIGGESVKVGAPIGSKVWISAHTDAGMVPAKAGSGPVTSRRPRRRAAPAARR